MEDRSFYVYAHYRLDTFEPFYIGKGKGGRKDKLRRNPIHDRISKKHGHAVVILYDNLTEEEAFFYEREVIEDLVFDEGYEIPCKNCGEFTKEFSYLTNFSFGGEGSYGYIHDEETKKNMSKAQRKRFKDPKEREKMGKTQRKRFEDPKEREKCGQPGEKNYGAKKVYCNELNILFSYIGIAEKYCKNVLNSKIGPIRDVCDGKRNFSGKLTDGTKLTWKWKKDLDKEILDKAEYIDSKKYEELLSQNVNDCNK